ncbi:translation initiation factor IF-2-like [Motacilla alba alba]|uniref:translation initiation factor IF-2-like n=1 Tax=Motacilla alba alba TaxID=1094192 RepID=UPI0018D544BF|nr:translation initiation factor IF-2-like [Motacilla alba alba]
MVNSAQIDAVLVLVPRSQESRGGRWAGGRRRGGCPLTEALGRCPPGPWAPREPRPGPAPQPPARGGRGASAPPGGGRALCRRPAEGGGPGAAPEPGTSFRTAARGSAGPGSLNKDQHRRGPALSQGSRSLSVSARHCPARGTPGEPWRESRARRRRPSPAPGLREMFSVLSWMQSPVYRWCSAKGLCLWSPTEVVHQDISDFCTYSNLVPALFLLPLLTAWHIRA